MPKKKSVSPQELEKQEQAIKNQSQDEFDAEIGFSNDVVLTGEQKELIRKLAHLHCTTKEIATAVGMRGNEEGLLQMYGDIIDEGREGGKMSIRRRMWRAAMEEGSVPMMMFLAKNVLGYFDDPLKKEEALKRSITRLSDEDLEKKVQQVIQLRKNKTGTHE